MQSLKHMPETPAQVWVGAHTELVQQTRRFLQQFLNSCQACGVCTACVAIEQKQHHAVTWLSPESSGYVLADLEPLFRTISFALEQDQHHIFVIQQADSLTSACSNSLLKVVEEPPAGYYFMFLTERLDALLPTLQSRCVIKKWQVSPSAQQTALSSFFVTTDFQSPHAFFQELEHQKPSEQTTMALLDQIFFYWISQVRQAYLTHDAKKKKEALRVIAILRKYFVKPLMPGSSKLLWRDLFLQMHCA